MSINTVPFTTLLVATRNRGKVREFREMFTGLGVTVTDLSGMEDRFEPAETGRTFLANACLKASAYARRFGAWALADDSGLCVDAIGGAPGIYSARFAAMNGAGTGDAANNAWLLKRLEPVEEARRSARFVCSLAVADEIGRIVWTTRGSIEGRILPSPRGENGFGYDPLFLVPELGKTTAELAPDEKHEISHRGRAMRRLKSLLEQYA